MAIDRVLIGAGTRDFARSQGSDFVSLILLGALQLRLCNTTNYLDIFPFVIPTTLKRSRYLFYCFQPLLYMPPTPSEASLSTILVAVVDLELRYGRWQRNDILQAVGA